MHHLLKYNRFINERISFNRFDVISVDMETSYLTIQSEKEMFTKFIMFLNKNINRINKLLFFINDTTKKEYYNFLLDAGLNKKLLEKSEIKLKMYCFYGQDLHNDFMGSFKNYDALINQIKKADKDYNDLLHKTKRDVSKSNAEIPLTTKENFYLQKKVFNKLKQYHNIFLVGGLKTQCLFEIEAYLKALNKKYFKYKPFIYGF